jgi:hypothetical protein
MKAMGVATEIAIFGSRIVMLTWSGADNNRT